MCGHHYNVVRCGWTRCENECGRWAELRGYCTTCYARRTRRKLEPLRPQNTCSVGACPKRLMGSGWPGMCAYHGYRMKRYGTPEPTDLAILITRLEARIDKRREAPCWRWTGMTTGTRRVYGIYCSHRAHRVVYEALIGPIPKGLQLDHLCRNTRCVNPEHLEPVTREENLRRGWRDAEPSPKATSYVNRRVGGPIRADFADFAEKFWKRVEIDPAEGCWQWTGAVSNGYGSLGLGLLSSGDYVVVKAHRYSHELLIGPIPPGAVVDHLCGNKACVNPAHLEAVAQRENTRRARQQ